MKKLFLFLFVSLIFTLETSFAQRNYAPLLQRATAPRIYLDDIILPGLDGREPQYVIIFRFDNDFIPFKKINSSDIIDAPDGMEYFAPLRMNAEIFVGKAKQKGKDLISASRDFWDKTVFAQDFEATQSKKKYAAGHLSTRLSPGDYHFMLQLTLGNSSYDRNSNKFDFSVPDFDKKWTGELYYVKSVQETAQGKELTLNNMEENVDFGQDVYALVRLPDYRPEKQYEVSVHKAAINKKDTTLIGSIYSKDIEAAEIYPSQDLALSPKTDPTIIMKNHDNGFTYALVHIPNGKFENSLYQLIVKEKGNTEIIAKKILRSFWSDMPASLYSLDVSIEMLRFLISKEEVKAMKEGKPAEQERKLRKFWDEKDPTPDTVFNELMAEYYRRIDYAYRNFSSYQDAGFDSDQGGIYIKYGPPNSIVRRLPPGGAAQEVWDYGNFKFIFEGTSGFGDFKLVNRVNS